MPPAFLGKSVNDVRELVERSIQRQVCHHFRSTIVLFDGCLSVPSTYPVSAAAEMLETLRSAKKNGNTVIGISKGSKISVSGRKMTSMLDGLSTPCLLHVGDVVGEQFRFLKLLGWMFVAKLSWEKGSFRLDVDKGLQFDDAVSMVRKLIGNDNVVQGYPETLRIAHMMSILTFPELIAIQRFLTKEYGLEIYRPQNVRRMLFGPFGN
jgi:hypothetical protein